jgi:hypothetical protein
LQLQKGIKMSYINRDVTFEQLMFINTEISKLQVFPSLGWVWTFDIIKDIFDNNQFDELAVNDYVDEAIPSGITLKQIFDKFFIDIDKLGIDMDMGGEILEETIRDWMRDNDFLVALDEDGWLDDEEDE